MKCPYCNYMETKVVDSRETSDYLETRRRRECLKCNKRFTTYETVENPDLFVVKSDGSKDLFDRTKIFRGVAKACDKREISHEQIENFVREIEAKVRSKYDREVKSKQIGQLILKKLYRLDVVAYIRFASVYQNFSDINSFIEIIQKVLENENKKNPDVKQKVSQLFESASEIFATQVSD